MKNLAQTTMGKWSATESNERLPFSRYYNSFGNGWSFSYQAQLIIEPTFIVAQRSDGKPISFDIEGSNFIGSSQRRERLTFDGSIYTLWLADNSYETYDTRGRLLLINYLNDEPISLVYAGNQIIISQSSNNLVLTINDNGQVIQAILPDSSTINYSYSDNNGHSILSMVTYPNNSTVQYLYEDTRFPSRITGVIDENGNRISSVQYDDQARAISSEKGPLSSGIERTQIQYNADGTRTVTNALGKQSTYHFTQFNGEYKITQVEGHPSDNCPGANKAYTYDTNGFMASKTDWSGNITTYNHNNRGQETSRTEASGTPETRTITTEWHTEFNLPTRITEPERETIMSYDARGRLLSRQIQPKE